jgi:hypothetical protein
MDCAGLLLAGLRFLKVEGVEMPAYSASNVSRFRAANYLREYFTKQSTIVDAGVVVVTRARMDHIMFHVKAGIYVHASAQTNGVTKVTYPDSPPGMTSCWDWKALLEEESRGR